MFISVKKWVMIVHSRVFVWLFYDHFIMSGVNLRLNFHCDILVRHAFIILCGKGNTQYFYHHYYER